MNNTHIKYTAYTFSRGFSCEYSSIPLKKNAPNSFKTVNLKYPKHRSSNPLISYE